MSKLSISFSIFIAINVISMSYFMGMELDKSYQDQQKYLRDCSNGIKDPKFCYTYDISRRLTR